MAAMIALPAPRVQRPRPVSAVVRLHQLHGESPKTWKDRMVGQRSVYHHAARINAVLVERGEAERAIALMAIAEAPLQAPLTKSLIELLDDARMADLMDDVPMEILRRKVREERATPAEIRDFLRRSAAARHHAEQAERKARELLDALEGRALGGH